MAAAMADPTSNPARRPSRPGRDQPGRPRSTSTNQAAGNSSSQSLAAANTASPTGPGDAWSAATTPTVGIGTSSSSATTAELRVGTAVGGATAPIVAQPPD